MMKLMGRLMSRRGATPGIVGALLLLQLGLVCVFASASTNEVFVAGRELHWDCLFKQRFGFPCPTCGVTRSVLLALHGNFRQAFEINPAGTLFVIGMVLFSGAMFLLMLYQRLDKSSSAQSLQQKITFWTTAYAGLIVAVLVAHWMREIIAFSL